MNKKTITAAVILLLAVIILAGGYFFLNSKKTSTPIVENNIPVTTSSPKSLKDLLGLGTSQQCTFSTVNGNDTTSGTVYVSGGKMRGDFTSNVSGQTTTSHMIVDGSTSYTWMEGQTTGYKMTIDKATGTTPSATAGPQASQGPDLNQQSNYNCSGWSADPTAFTPPTNINFLSLSDLIPSPSTVKGTGTSGANSQCAYCDSLTGDSKTQCKSALNCP